MKFPAVVLLLLVACLVGGSTGRTQTVVASESISQAKLVDVRRIWDGAPHNAFTDLVRHAGSFVCVFREGQGHVSPDGAIRVIGSKNGRDWSSLARIEVAGADLRDPKVVITPDGRFMIVAAAARNRKPGGEADHQSMVWFSKDAQEWGRGREVADRDFWLWRVAWHGDRALGVGYGTTRENKRVRLYDSQDGTSFHTRLDNLFDKGYPNESGLAFLDDGTCVCLLRRDEAPRTGMLGTSPPPYTSWSWRDLGVAIGGPQLLRIPDGRFVAGVRLYDRKVRTALGWIDPQAGTFREFLTLPSGGDTSYPGLVWYDNLLWVSYYSSHEGKTSIYLARVRLPQK